MVSKLCVGMVFLISLPLAFLAVAEGEREKYPIADRILPKHLGLRDELGETGLKVVRLLLNHLEAVPPLWETCSAEDLCPRVLTVMEHAPLR